jgi:hypothetical protein
MLELRELSRGFPQYVQTIHRTVPRSGLENFTSKSFAIHYSPIVLSFDAIQTGYHKHNKVTMERHSTNKYEEHEAITRQIHSDYYYYYHHHFIVSLFTFLY